MGIGETGNNLLPLDLRKQGIEEQDEEVPQQRQLEDVEEHRGDGNSSSNCA